MDRKFSPLWILCVPWLLWTLPDRALAQGHEHSNSGLGTFLALRNQPASQLPQQGPAQLPPEYDTRRADPTSSSVGVSQNKSGAEAGQASDGSSEFSTMDTILDYPEATYEPQHSVELGFGLGFGYGPLKLEQVDAKYTRGGQSFFLIMVPVGRHVNVGFTFAQSEVGVHETTPNKYKIGALGTPAQSRTGCVDCPPPKMPGRGVAGALYSRVIGPMIDLRPWADRGWFVSAGVGVGILKLIDDWQGVGFLARLGYKHILADRISIGGGLGFQGIVSKKHSIYQPTVFVESRLLLF